MIKCTFSTTTQFAAINDSPPLKRHYKSRFPMLNKPRIHEMFCTDTWFGSTPAVGGYTCVQLYYGVRSRFLVVYPMISESQGPETLEDLCRDRGAPVRWLGFDLRDCQREPPVPDPKMNFFNVPYFYNARRLYVDHVPGTYTTHVCT